MQMEQTAADDLWADGRGSVCSHSAFRLFIWNVEPEDHMFPPLLKRTFVAIAILLALAFGVLWFFQSSPPPVRAAFLCVSNDFGYGRVGVVELVNNLNEKVG